MTRLRLGFIPLSDCAVLAVAHERGFFRRHGLEVELSREVSWANIRDKIAIGMLDGAQMLAGMPLAAAAGLDPVAPPLLTACSLGLNGNAITVSSELWRRMIEADPAAMATRATSAAALRGVIDACRRGGAPRLRFAVVYPYSTHNYELRYWLAAAGIDPDADVQLTVVAPPRVVEALEQGVIDGFCVGEPWSSLAVNRGLGHIAITKYDIWQNSPEKVLAVRHAFAERHPALHQALLRALIEAAAWSDPPERRIEVARLLAEPRYVGAPLPLLIASLSGRPVTAPHAAAAAIPDFHVFHRYAATFPWISHAVWILAQMLRWGQVEVPIDAHAVARGVYRPDLYREAAGALGMSAPAVDSKREGIHHAPWRLEGTQGAIEMGSDLFLDGRVFDPAQVVAYLAGSSVRAPRVSLDALAALNP